MPEARITVRRMYFMKAFESQRPKIMMSFGSVLFSHSMVAKDVRRVCVPTSEAFTCRTSSPMIVTAIFTCYRMALLRIKVFLPFTTTVLTGVLPEVLS